MGLGDFSLPLRDRVLGKFLQAQFFVDCLDPIERNDVMLRARPGVAFGENDLVGIFHAIDNSHMRAVGTD